MRTALLSNGDERVFVQKPKRGCAYLLNKAIGVYPEPFESTRVLVLRKRAIMERRIKNTPPQPKDAAPWQTNEAIPERTLKQIPRRKTMHQPIANRALEEVTVAW